MNVYWAIGVALAVVIVGLVSLWFLWRVHTSRRGQPKPIVDREAILRRLLEADFDTAEAESQLPKAS